MAGIGVRLNRIFSKHTMTTNLLGFGYSLVITIAPMFLVIFALMLMQLFLGYSKIDYATRELYASTVLYIFVFSLLTASPLNGVFSRYMSDIIYEEKYDDIMPCYYFGLALNVAMGFAVSIPFFIREYLVGQVEIALIFVSFCGFMALLMVFYTMLFLSICKDYKKISFFYLVGMVTTVLLSLVLVYILHMSVIYAMLISLDVGFLVIGSLEYGLICSYFRENSGSFKNAVYYFKKNWQLVITNFLYTLGLFIHNFVFWTTDMHIVVVKCFVSMTTYDMASCIAMFTNLTSSVIFITRVEMYFHERYKKYSEAVIGGRGIDIQNAQDRMFSQLSEELMNLVRIQFIISVVIFFIAIIFLPMFGFGGIVMQIYPCLAAGYFILFTMYAAIIFQYYFNDLNGALLTSFSFFACTFLGSVYATKLEPAWYGIGLVFGSMVGWTCAYFRLRVMERRLDTHIFCDGTIMKKGHGKKPSNKVYDRRLEMAKAKRKAKAKA